LSLKAVYDRDGMIIYCRDAREALSCLPSKSVQCCITSPPYYSLRDYQIAGQIGLEETPQAYICSLLEVFAEVWRVLRDDGTLWVVLGDSYPANRGTQVPDGKFKAVGNSIGMKVPDGFKPKNLLMMPARVAIALQEAGWYVRSEIVWAKRAPMPESVTDRPTSSHEKIFLMSKRPTYFYDAEAVREEAKPESLARYEYGLHCKTDETGYNKGIGNGFQCNRMGDYMNPAGRNMRNVWHLSPEPYPDAHFATFPMTIPKRAILAGTSERGCCPKCGKGWKRIVEKEQTGDTRWSKKGGLHRANAPGAETSATSCFRTGSWNRTETIDWQPSCQCSAGEPVPCTVIDPFAGAFTTGLVAAQLGRRFIGIELNRDYIRMGIKRMGPAIHQQIMRF